MQEFTIVGAEVFLPDQIVETTVTVTDGVISAIGGAGTSREIDGRGRLLAPAMIDIHGDAFERQLMPRPNVFFPMEAALLETDRQLASNGIATAYHALSISWEPGLRSVERAREMIRAIMTWADRLTVENRIQLRWETFCLEGIDLLKETLDGPLTPSLAFNDHTSMAMLHPDMPLQRRPFEHSSQFPVVNADDPAFRAKMAGRAERSGLSTADYAELLKDRWRMRPLVRDAIAEVGQLARSRNAPMLSHDDTQDETRDFYRNHGATISEFPMAVSVAAVAQERRRHGGLWRSQCGAWWQPPWRVAQCWRHGGSEALLHSGLGLLLSGDAGSRGPSGCGKAGGSPEPLEACLDQSRKSHEAR